MARPGCLKPGASPVLSKVVDMRGSLDASDWSENQHCEPANGPLRADLRMDAHARPTGYGPADASIWGRWPGHNIGAQAPEPAPSDEELRPSSLASEPLFTHRTRDAWPVLVDALTIAAALGAILAVRAQLWSSVGTAIPWWALLPSVVGVRLLGLALFGVY